MKTDVAMIRWGVVFLIMVICSWGWGLFGVGSDIHQGEVYRIIYIHVPTCLTAFVCALYLFVVSVYGLKSKNLRSLWWGQACAEAGLLFTALGLATGSIWGRVTWNVWWTWDARLLTTFILGVLFTAYLLLQSALPAGVGRIKASAVLGILIFIDIPIIYKSVTWWRTLHQPPSIGTGAMSAEIQNSLIVAITTMIIFMTWMVVARKENLRTKSVLDDLAHGIN